MRVNDLALAHRHSDMCLRRSGLRHQQVAGAPGPGGLDKPGSEQDIARDGEAASPRSVVGRQRQLDADRGKAGDYEADAIETEHGIAPLQAERRANQITRREGERGGAIRHAREG